jgi:hypothetical protein
MPTSLAVALTGTAGQTRKGPIRFSFAGAVVANCNLYIDKTKTPPCGGRKPKDAIFGAVQNIE